MQAMYALYPRVCHVAGSYLVLNSLFLFFPNSSAECTYAEMSFFKQGEVSIHYLAAYNS